MGDGNGTGRGGADAGRGAGRGPGLGGGRNRERRNRARQGGGKDRVLFAQGALGEGPFQTVVCCVDDTDDLSGDISTGAIAELVANAVPRLGGRVVLGITRHQLLLAEGVPYTSHNSSMAFMAQLPVGKADELARHAERTIAEKRAPTSDPGLCVAVVPEAMMGEPGAAGAQDVPGVEGADIVRQVEALEAFGRRAKEHVCTKDEAYALAEAVPWVRLSEHGGTGDGVIGALAGVGLRLGGNDGRFRGQWDLADMLGAYAKRGALCAGQLRERLSALAAGPVAVVDFCGGEIGDDEPVALARKAKPVLADGALTLVADAQAADGEPLGLCESPDRLEGTHILRSGAHAGERGECVRFAADNDPEECAHDARRGCRNCLYRRWTAKGFSCMHDLAAAG